MNLSAFTVGLLATSCLSWASQAADLLPPRSLNPQGLTALPGAPTGCSSVSVGHHVRGAKLIVRDAVRADVGPYRVRLPGYSTGAENLYRPFLVTAKPGDTLRFDLVDQLRATPDPMADAINLHTHGLIVSPRRCAPFGDSVYVEAAPQATAHYAIPIPATVPGAMFAGGGPDRPYPAGLNWFHAHLHGKAGADVMAGQAGMLEVGDLLADLRATPNLPSAAKAVLNATDVRYLGLRDIQLGVPAGAEPDQPQGVGAAADWLQGDNYDPGACPSQANPPVAGAPTPSFAGPGYCAQHGLTVGTTSNSNRDRVWLFTVNGQAFPTIRSQAGRNQLWRVANLSASVTYLLQLVHDATPTTAESMVVVSLDGLVAGTPVSGGTGLKVGVTIQNLLLMPASRAEIFLPASIISAGPMTLRTAGFTTGADADPWPAIELAHVVPPAASPASSASPSTAALRREARPAVPSTAAPTAGPQGMPSGFPDIILPRAAQRSASPAMVPRTLHAEHAPANCITLPKGQTVRRRITFANDATGGLFLLGSEVVTPDGTPIDAAHGIPAERFPAAAMTAPEAVRHVCPRLGEQEVWELVNTTGEIHNFHIHQSKFRLAVPSDPGVPGGSLAMQDPTGLIARYVPEAQGAAPNAEVDVWHDTLPVPPAAADGTPGRVFVTIPFHARQQVGFFVYHCHILEHEDGGMMAVVQVFDPAAPTANVANPGLARMGHH